MQLVIKRSQRQGGVLGGKLYFVLDARAVLSNEENALVRKYGLGNLSIYDSENRKKNLGAALGHFDDSVQLSRESAGRSFLKVAAGIGRAAMASLSLKVSIESLAAGQHIECKDLQELLGAEEAIRESCNTLKAYLATAESFDGREEVIEF